MNQLNTLHSNEPTEPPIDWNIQTLEVHLKSRTSPHKTIPMVLDIIGMLNHLTIDNSDAEFYPS